MIRHSALYIGQVDHARRSPVTHRFGYRVAMLYLDLDELDQVFAATRLLRRGRLGLWSFTEHDHLDRRRGSLKNRVLDAVEDRLGFRPAGPVRLLTQGRTCGYAFNPLSVHYCFDTAGRSLEALLLEVTNTPWFERHVYAIDRRSAGGESFFEKTFHVSPFFGMAQSYRLTADVPGAGLRLELATMDRGAHVFSAGLTLARRPITTTTVGAAALRHPAGAWRLHAAIYWQALRLWRKGAPFHPHPGKEPSWKV